MRQNDKRLLAVGEISKESGALVRTFVRPVAEVSNRDN